ncbi:hypothetical protein KR067_001571, partial [Drosophila pandora]
DGISLRFSNFVCQSYNASSTIVNYCRLKAVSRDRVVLHYNATFLHPIHTAAVRLKAFKRESGFKPWLLETTIDCCRYMRKTYNPLARLVYKTVKEFTNINHSCPYEGDQIVNGFYVKPELIILPVPSGTYMISLKWFLNQMHQLDTNVTFEIIEDLIKS